MKYNKKILEAINRGILIALDDYDEEQSSNFTPKRNTIKNNNSAKELIDFYSQFVDLELPSGTLWCKYNLGLDPNKVENLYGNYYAWGETEPKNDYSWKTYKHCKYHPETDTVYFTKYCANHMDGNVDNLMQLLLIDDAAYQFDNRLKMPTEELFEELIKYTKLEVVENYKNVGISGILFTKDDKELFFPSIGYLDKKIHKYGEYIYYWSSNIKKNSERTALFLSIDFFEIVHIGKLGRNIGMAIRPVLNKN